MVAAKKSPPGMFRVMCDPDFLNYGRQGPGVVAEFPLTLLEVRPGISWTDARALAVGSAPGFDFDSAFNRPKTGAFRIYFSPRAFVRQIELTTGVIDDVTIAGVTLRASIDAVTAQMPGLKRDETVDALAALRGTLPGSIYRQAGEFDLQVSVTDGRVSGIQLLKAGSIEAEAANERKLLDELTAAAALTAQLNAWRSIAEPDEMLRSWASTRRMHARGNEVRPGEINEWEWLARRLPASSPDAWHDFAGGYNWDGDLAPLLWIIRQRECDKATALMIFFLGSPEYFADQQLEGRVFDAGADDVFALVGEIRQRWLAGQYTRSEIALDPKSVGAPDPDDPQHAAFIPASMRAAIVGRKVTLGLFFQDAPQFDGLFS